MRGLYIEESVVETSEDEFYRMDSTPDESEHPGSEES